MLALRDADAARLTITGDLTPGSTVTVAAANWRGLDGDMTYQWYVGGVEVAGATGPEYTLADDDAGASILVRATSTVAGATLLVSSALQVGEATAPEGGDGLTGLVLPIVIAAV
ncbi:MAG TPA: hypothetical protein PK890_09240, partial [Terrimesophilobacter sp.]|nr:hypothetical protein [Terrimesophilobacter sp.]